METAACREMPRYRCHKQVWALKIKEIQRDAVTLLVFEDPGYAAISVSYDWDTKHNPQPGGYYVVYQDGYVSYSPAKAFEEGYTAEPATFRDRVKLEHAEIEARLDKLTAFNASPTFESLPEAEQERLVRQAGVMVQYSDVLAERIAAFPA